MDTGMAGNLLCIVLNQLISKLPIDKLSSWILRSPLVGWLDLDPKNITTYDLKIAISSLCVIYPDGTIENNGLELQKELTRIRLNEKEESTRYCYYETEQPYPGTRYIYGETGPFPRSEVGNITGYSLVTNDENGYPVVCAPIHGFNNEAISIRDTIDSLKERQFQHLTIIANKSMILKKKIQAVLDAGYDIMGAVPESNEESWEYISRWPPNDITDQGHAIKRPSGKIVYLRDWIGPFFGKKKMRLIIVEDPERRTDESIGRVQALKEMKSPLTIKRYNELRKQLGKCVGSKIKTHGFVIDKKQIEINSRGDGRSLIFNTDTSKGAAHIIRVYYRKNIVNDIFRANIDEAQTGPIRFRRKDRIEAYATVNYLAYLIWTASEQKLKREKPNMTLIEALTQVEDVSWIHSSNKNLDRYWITDLTNGQREIMNVFDALKIIPVS
jgi:hypothetical protein